ncbi:hypothetical protein Taro_016923 [Colocasia esculenta]|uniref:Uncharacterized protein n=1 Tax=Colocasia esculenta TaxID=4460 RepID=A0A843UF02_COLES|nr:hypothetical protein [Colocasia esculenta]
MVARCLSWCVPRLCFRFVFSDSVGFTRVVSGPTLVVGRGVLCSATL